MPLAPWRSPLARALHRNRALAYARYVQLATVRPDGRPANRTVVFRGFLDGSDRLQMITDSRSDKALQIQEKSWGEMCWYFPKTREQFRLMGTLDLIGETHDDPTLVQARRNLWANLSDNARAQFAWPHPGKPRSPQEAFTVEGLNDTEPLANFCLLLLDPVQVDHLELRGEPQSRHQYELQENLQGDPQDESEGDRPLWRVCTVNP